MNVIKRLHSRVRQNNNTVGGHNAGGDVNVSENVNFNILPEKKSPLRIMVENYCSEIEQSGEKKEFIEELQDYMKRVPGRDQRSLTDKLLAAQREDLVDNALLLKEKFSKKLYKHTFSPSAQKIFVHILSMINSSFHLKIKPLIHEDKPSSVVDKAIFDEIIREIYCEVGNSELDINMDYIHGMLYYLTGNCYINWK